MIFCIVRLRGTFSGAVRLEYKESQHSMLFLHYA